jgi:hypothetical protein
MYRIAMLAIINTQAMEIVYKAEDLGGTSHG